MLTSMMTLMIALSLFFVVVTLIRARALTLQQDSRGSWVEALPEMKIKIAHWIIPLLAVGYIGYHHLTVTSAPILAPSELVSTQQPIELRGTVEKIESEGNQHRILLSDSATQVEVQFSGNLPGQLRTHWGAHVNGSVQQSAEKTVVTANSIAALNIRDHSGYVMAAYGIALVTLLLNLLGALRSGREARQGIARRLRQESNS